LEEKMIHKLGCVLIALALSFTAAAAQADQFFSQDQANLVAPYEVYNISALNPLEQTFIPALGRLNRIDLRIEDAGSDIGSGAQIMVRVHQGTGSGPIVGSSQTILVPDGFSGYATFPFASQVTLNPGFLYTMEAVQSSNDIGSINYGWTTGNGDTYSKGSPSVGGGFGITPAGDFLFRTGLTQDNRLDLTPAVQGAVEQPLPSGTRQILSSSFIDYVLDSDPNTFDRQTRAITEYDLSQLVGHSGLTIQSATLSGEVSVNNSLETGPRNIAIDLYNADLALTAADYDATAQQLTTVSYDPATSSGVPFNLDVTSQIQALLAGGGSAVGFRFDPLNLQPPSAISDYTPPILTITLAEVPEPTSLALLALMPLGFRRRRRS
jgi:hypothetical protein